MKLHEIQSFRASLRAMVRELGMLSRKVSNTGLSPLQSHILIELEHCPLGVTELAELLCVEKASVSRTIKGLIESELLMRVADENDARASTFSLTQSGQQALLCIEENANDFIRDALTLASESEKESFSKVITALTSSLRNARLQRERQIIIRPITPADNAAIAEIVRESFRENKVDHLEGISLHDPGLETLAEIYSHHHSGYWVAEADGEILGGAGLAPLAGADGDYCEMQKLFFKSKVKGNGLGRRMVALILQEAPKRGYKYCYLETLPELKAAVRLYEAFGFRHLKSALGNTGHNSCEIHMLKSLVFE